MAEARRKAMATASCSMAAVVAEVKSEASSVVTTCAQQSEERIGPRSLQEALAKTEFSRVQQQMVMRLQAGPDVKEEAGDEQRLTGDGKKIGKDDINVDSMPQNALLKQLLQNSQPQRKSTEEKEHELDEQVTLTPEQQRQLELIDKMPLTQEVGDGTDGDLKTKIRRMQEAEECQKKRRQPQQKRQPKQPKCKDGIPAKKRPRKGSNAKPEEDYESYMESMMNQLRALPPLRIMEPDIPPCFNVCPVFGSGDIKPVRSPEDAATNSKLRGTFGNATLVNQVDFYSVYPYGSNPPTPPASLPPTPPPHRGFYSQEFPSRIRDTRRSIVEVPASLPTPPPHADQRHTPSRDVDSPDTIISASSPECVYPEPPDPFRCLRLIQDNDDGSGEEYKSISPCIPLISTAPIKVVAIRPKPDEKLKEAILDEDDTKDKENQGVGLDQYRAETALLKSKLGLSSPAPLKESGNVSVTLTLTSAAAEDITGVLSAVANLLKVPAPPSYEIIERTATPPSQKLGLYKKGRDVGVNIQSILNGKPRFCRHCDVVVLNAGIRKKVSELPFLSKDEQDEEEVIFCSTSCYMQFAISHRTVVTEEKEAATVVDHLSDDCAQIPPTSSAEIKSETPHTLQSASVDSNEGKTIQIPKPCQTKTVEGKEMGEVKVLSETSGNRESTREERSNLQKEETSGEDETESRAPAKVPSSVSQESVPTPSPTVVIPEKSPRGRKHQTADDVGAGEPSIKKWRGLRWKYWNISIVPPKKYAPATNEEINEIMIRLGICIRPKSLPEDNRTCVLCHDMGDGYTNGPARLLNMDVDKWIHLNCALWSGEVYETVNGALMNVDVALKRSCTLECQHCHKKGATLGCFKLRCTNIYHFGCALKEKCMFFKDKTMLCPQHIPKQMTPELRENELSSLSVFRRVYVNREETRQVACIMHQGDQRYLLRVGSLIFLSVGQLLPHQLQAFHTPNCIFPVGFKIIRMYWSMYVLGKRCQYVCSIYDKDGKPEFRIQVKDDGHEELMLRDSTAKGVWQQVLEPIERMRREAKTIKVFSAFITGEDLFGLTEPSILRVLESLPGVETLSDYNFKYGRSPLLELPLAINPTGCARSEPKLRTHFKRPHTLHTSSSSRSSSFQSTFTGLEVACPYTKQFVHSKSSQYRRMKLEWRNNIYLARSRIQGLGLYASRDLEKHTMVIEYIGQTIRNEVAETRERMYEAQNRGIYMFRLDDCRVIDATLCGGLARYINHSCNPNCVAEVVLIDRENRIIIFANRRISRGEELTYDYKFDIEDDQHKIPCLCGAPNCRKWMN